ncbi:hypothetical protein JCGZ_25315 [Jatropha curcas]|uniref:Uncharacterized protein n=1 Tax=Jatropha curcas TaxID=180498 RepID=A0A067JLG9_JATCU|nr:hypothetical protein JCGZ_25315 [Jatropha curcas]
MWRLPSNLSGLGGGCYTFFYSLTLLYSCSDSSSKHVRRGSDSEAPDTAVIFAKLGHDPGASFSFISELTGQTTQGMLETHLVSPYRMSPPSCTHVSIIDHNEVCQLYEATLLKLAVARVSNKHISHCPAVLAGKTGIYFHLSNSTGLATTGIWSPIQTVAKYLLLSGIDSYGILRLVPIVEKMAKRHTPFPFILTKTFTWLGENARDSSSVLGPMGRPLLLQQEKVLKQRERNHSAWRWDKDEDDGVDDGVDG